MKHMKRQILLLALLSVSFVSRAFSIDCEQYKAYQAQLDSLTSNYEQELGFLADPFLVAFSQEDANAVYDRLLRRSEGLFCANSPLFKIQHELKQPRSPEFNADLVSEIIQDAQVLLTSSAQIHDLQSNLLALQSTRDYLNRFAVCPFEQHDQDKDGSKKQDDQAKKQEKQQKPQQKPKQSGQKQSQQQQQKSDQPDDEEEEYPEFGDDYKPHTKDTGGDGDSGNKTKSKTIIAEVNFKTRYFGINVFTQMVRHNPMPLQKSTRLAHYYEALFNNNGASAASQKTMIVRPLGKQHIKLFMPPGYQPATRTVPHATIELDGKGSFDLIMDAPLDRVAIPLAHQQHHVLDKFQEEILTEHVGFDGNEWPAALQSAILHQFKQGDDIATIAKALEKHISTAYLYSKDARPETDPVDALNTGAFQCDMAAYTMASILRDAYNIPCRVIAGFRAKMRKTGVGEKSYLINSKEGHAWVEVFHDGTWNVYDPTPIKKDKEDEGEGEKSEFTDVPPEDQQQPQDDQNKQQDQQKKSEGSSKTDSEKEDQKSDEQKSEDQKASDKKAKEDEKKQDDAAEDQKKLDVLPELDGSLANLLLPETPLTNPLQKECLKLLLIEALNPLKEGNEAASRLDMLKNVFAALDKDRLGVVKEALDQHKDAHEPMLNWIKELQYNIFDQDINATHKDLLRMLKILMFYRNVIDSDGMRSLISEIINEITATIQLLHPLKDKAAADMALLDDVKKSSPLLLWQTLQQMYGLNAIGPNAPTQDLAKALRDGKHNDHLLLSSLYPATNFISDPSRTSGSMLVKTWLRDGQKRGRDLLPTERIEDWRYAIPTDHRYDLIENIKRASAFVLTKRKKVAVPIPSENKEAKRISIVGFDVSGSMAGQNAEFQAALLAAFVCRALEDVSPTGVHRHTVLLVPFGSDVYVPIEIKSSQQALDLIKNHQQMLANRGDGTDIQKFLMQAMKLISDAQDAKNPFEIANIILMSDGGSSVDYDELTKARKLIHRDTPIQMMFAAIGSTNPDLQKFALDSKSMGAKKGFYKEFLGDEINKLVNDAHTIDMKKYDKYFFSSDTPDHIPPHVADHLMTAYKKLESLSIQIRDRMSGQGLSYRQNLALFGNNHPKENFNARPLEGYIHAMRQMMANAKYAGVFHDDMILNFIINHLVNNFQKITGVAPTALTQFENEEMVHWLENPHDAQTTKHAGKP